MQNKIKILVVGDIIGKGARNAFINYLPQLKEQYNYDIIAINGENTTHGNGLNYKHYKLYKNNNIDVITMGNHLFGQKEIFDYIDKTDTLVVPGNINYQNEKFNCHKKLVLSFGGQEIIFLNLLSKGAAGKEFEEIIDPLAYFDSIYQTNPEAIYIVDYHSEYTLEKNLFGYYVDGRATLVYGTHTHVQTSDERILPKGCGYISDVGMCGAIDSIIGYDYQSYLDKISKNTMTSVANNRPFMINALYVEISLSDKKILKLERINQKKS